MLIADLQVKTVIVRIRQAMRDSSGPANDAFARGDEIVPLRPSVIPGPWVEQSDCHHRRCGRIWEG